MRLGILGPANDDLIGLARAAQFLVDEAHAEKVIYLCHDRALERVVVSWAREIVGADPSGEASFKRAAARCARAAPAEIDAFVAGERARLRLKAFVSLASVERRTIEILDGRMVLFVYDKAVLDAEDLAAAQLIVYGKSPAPTLERTSGPVFLAPGPIGSPQGGAALLDDGVDGIRMDILGPGGVAGPHDYIRGLRTARLRVHGGA